MTDDLPWFGPEPDDREPRKCRHPKWQRVKVYEGILPAYQKCDGCGHVFDEADRKLGKNNRLRGVRAELVIARKFPGGRKVGQLGLPHDVETHDLRIQVKKLATPPSLRAIVTEMRRIPPGEKPTAFAWIEPGQGGESLTVMNTDDLAALLWRLRDFGGEE